MSTYAINKALYDVKKRYGLKADIRDYPENYVGHESKPQTVKIIHENDYVTKELMYRIEILDRKIDTLSKNINDLRTNPPIKELVKPIVILTNTNTTKKDLEEKLFDVMSC